ncbi:hypothetical protein ACHAWF_008281 [Thalassiosira exigua]
MNRNSNLMSAAGSLALLLLSMLVGPSPSSFFSSGFATTETRRRQQQPLALHNQPPVGEARQQQRRRRRRDSKWAISSNHHHQHPAALWMASSSTSSATEAIVVEHDGGVVVCAENNTVVVEAATAAAEASSSPATTPSSPGAVLAATTADQANAGAAVDAILERPSDWASLWKRRLITSEDPYSVHKIASVLYTISGFGILAVAAFQALTGNFATVPVYLEWPTYAFFWSNVVMCSVSVRMAFLHRKFDLTARNGFLGTAASSLFSGFFMLWTSPFPAADIFNDASISRACFAVFVALNTYFIMDTVSKTEEVVEGRLDRKAGENYDERLVLDAFLYILPVAAALPAVVATAYIQSVLHDRLWYWDQCALIYETTGIPFNAHGFYVQIIGSLAASAGALFVTLRDKKLVSKTVEYGGITVLSVPALVWTVFVGYTFIASML